MNHSLSTNFLQVLVICVHVNLGFVISFSFFFFFGCIYLLFNNLLLENFEVEQPCHEYKNPLTFCDHTRDQNLKTITFKISSLI